MLSIFADGDEEVVVVWLADGIAGTTACVAILVRPGAAAITGWPFTCTDTDALAYWRWFEVASHDPMSFSIFLKHNGRLKFDGILSKSELNWPHTPHYGEKIKKVLKSSRTPFQDLNVSDSVWIHTTESQRYTSQVESKLDRFHQLCILFPSVAFDVIINRWVNCDMKWNQPLALG